MNDITIHLSKHAEERLKQRLGLNRKAARRHTQKAFKDGLFPRDYSISLVAEEYDRRQKIDDQVMFLIFKNFVHVFGMTPENEPILLTVYDPLSARPIFKRYVQGQERTMVG